MRSVPIHDEREYCYRWIFTIKIFTNTHPADGVLGLADPSISKFRTYPLLASLVKQGKLINLAFSLKLTSTGAEIYIGGANSMLYNGNIAYTRVTYPGFWQVSSDDIRVNAFEKLLQDPYSQRS